MSGAEFLTSLEIGLIYGVVAVGIFLTFRIIDFPDLTCDGSFTCGAATAAVALKASLSPLTSLLLAASAGGLAGLATGILYVKFKVTNLLSGILVAFMLYSLNLKIMGGIPNITLMNEGTLFVGSNALMLLIAISLGIGSLLSYLLATDFGLALRSIGQNQQLAKVMGVRLASFTVAGLTLSNALIGLGGGLYCQHQSFSDVSLGIGTVIIGLAAVMIGEKLLPFRSLWLNVFACFLGSIVYRLLIALALHSEWLGLETSDLNLITGLAILAIMVLPQLKGKSTCSA
ncbi:ABC transporter permease [Candidatus Paracaedibacter symbiosus]|uniref:ABC transporter permease n=1 Tax=Candidatus Paracaedibacter symbiosus TaxID=244582 RepID=UPI00050A0038|nr:ABC transporter permease [Candidatus Paracaedibacter symbiosus]